MNRIFLLLIIVFTSCESIKNDMDRNTSKILYFSTIENNHLSDNMMELRVLIRNEKGDTVELPSYALTVNKNRLEADMTGRVSYSDSTGNYMLQVEAENYQRVKITNFKVDKGEKRLITLFLGKGAGYVEYDLNQ